MTDPDPVQGAMQEAQSLNGDRLRHDPVPVEPGANVLREVTIEPKPENSEVNFEPEPSKPTDLEAMPTLDPSLVSPDGEAGEPAKLNYPVVTTAPIQMPIEDRSETFPPKQADGPELTVNKITWPLIGRLADPGRYMFRFGWLTVTAADLAIWTAYPNAAFTLISTSTPPPAGTGEESAGEEFRLGTFELRTDSNYSESEK